MSKAAELANLIGNINAGGGGTNKNLLINGDMSVSQRATSVTNCADSGAYRAVDRWYFNVYSGTFTVSQSSTTPDGFGSSHKFDCTTAETPGAADSTMFYQHMEGQNLQAIKKGTSEAKPLSASFWVRSNLTGTATVELVDNDTSSYRTCSQSYTINSANTWEHKTVTFPADTTGALDNDNASSMYFAFWLVAGSNYTGGTLATSWQGLTNANRAVGQTINIGSSTDNEFYITGVQLEIGQNATEFEHEPFDVTLNKCYRYFLSVARVRGSARGSATGGQQLASSFGVPVQMRAAPSVSHVDVERSGCSHEGYTNVNANHIGVMVDVSSTSYWYYNDGFKAESEL